jgi:hypothetical protein
MVSSYVNQIAQQLKAGDVLGIEMFDECGPYPYDYDSEIRSALGILGRVSKQVEMK